MNHGPYVGIETTGGEETAVGTARRSREIIQRYSNAESETSLLFMRNHIKSEKFK